MKKIAFCFLLFLHQASAATYYVKATGGNGTGLDDTNAWSYAKFNSMALSAGDKVLFKRADTFYGALTAQSGATGNAITYGAYGTGANPVITGLSPLTSWTLASGSIYSTPLGVPALNIVILDGAIKGMGRYPKTGYLTYTSHSGNNSITGSAALPFNPKGAEVVIRKIRQITDRHLITAYSGNTISLSSAGAYGSVYLNNTSYQPSDGNGYFIQSSINTLTDSGDWYYDSASGRLYMYFGTGTPDSHRIQAATVAVLAQLDNKNYIAFESLDFEGANRDAITSNNSNTIAFTNCNFRKSYGGIFADNGITNLTVQGGSMTDIINNGLRVPQSGSNVVVDGTSMTNIGTVAGAGGSGDAMQLGVWIQGDNSTVKNSLFKNIGYHGIVLYGNNTLVEKNLIDTYGLTKDDCGGIYEFQFSGIKNTNKIIRNNIILNGIGVAAGAPSYDPYGQAAGIYLDENVNNVKVYNNTLAHGSWGGILLVGVGDNNEITTNLAYDFSRGLLLTNLTGQSIRNTTIKGNNFIAKTAAQCTLYLDMYADDNPSLYGTFTNNVYARPVDDNTTISINKKYSGGGGVKDLSLSIWKSTYSLDANSSKSTVTTGQSANLRFDYNYSGRDSTLALDTPYTTVSTTATSSTVTLPAYGGAVLIKTTMTAAPAATDTTCSAKATPSGSQSYYNQSGPCNAFVGNRTGYSTSSGYYNAFFGTNAGFSNTIGFNNTFVGTSAGYQTTTGYFNTLVGNNAGFNNTAGFSNIAVGTQAGYKNKTGSNTIMIGDSAGFNNTISSNLFVGSKAGYTNLTGQKSTFIGYQSGYNSVADSNTFVGYRSGYTTTTGKGNTFFGAASGRSNTVGSHNTFVGNGAGPTISSGSDNVYIGYNTMGAGSNNTFLGAQAGSAGQPTLVNATAIGAGTQVIISNALVLGNNANVGIGTSAPATRLEIVDPADNASGLRISKLTAASPSVLATDQFLTVNEQGDVIKARYQLRINNTNEWSDKVFSSTYALRSLRTVEDYIRQHGHLPGIPSATQVVQNGVDLAKLSATLLEKIEELTLYTIQQEKAQQQQQTINHRQQQEIDKLKRLLR